MALAWLSLLALAAGLVIAHFAAQTRLRMRGAGAGDTVPKMLVHPRLGVWLNTLSLVALAAGISMGLGVWPAFYPFVLVVVQWLWIARLLCIRHRRFDEQLPGVLRMLASGVRAGSNVLTAIAQAVPELPVPSRTEFQRILVWYEQGHSLAHGVGLLAAEWRSNDLRLLALTLELNARSGTGLAGRLDRLADQVFARLELARKIRSITALGRAQAWVLGLMPAGLFIVLHTLDPVSMSKAFTTPAGWTVGAVFAALYSVAIILVRRVLRVEY